MCARHVCTTRVHRNGQEGCAELRHAWIPLCNTEAIRTHADHVDDLCQAWCTMSLLGIVTKALEGNAFGDEQSLVI